MKLLLVFIGGGVGSVIRYLITRFFSSSYNFPFGTLIVNVLGSLLIGVVIGLSFKSNFISEHQKLLFATGFCGGFTTFSTLVYESEKMLESSDFTGFFLYTVGTFALGIVMILLGLYIAK